MAESYRDEIRNRGSRLFNEDKKEHEKIDNLFLKMANKTYSQEQMDLISSEHQMEIEKLLLEISRLHDFISDLENGHRFETQRLKEDMDNLNHLQINNMKQAHMTQI